MGKGRDGLHGARIREANERGIIAAIRQGGAMTKSELAGELGLTRQAVNIIVGEMIAGGFLREGGRKTGGVGRSSAYYALDASAAFSVGMVVEPGRIEAMLVDFLGAVHYRVTLVTGPDEAGPAASVLDGVAAAIRDHCRAGGIGMKRVAGLCAVLPDAHFVRSATQGGGIAPAALRPRLEAAFGLPAYVERRAAASAVAEFIRAEGALPSSFAFLCCDHGVGAALMLDGALHRGEHDRAMCLGRLPAGFAPAGGTVPLEAVASLDALAARLAEAGVDGSDIHAARAARPDLVDGWVAEAGAALGGAAALLQMMADVGAVVIDIALPGSLAHRLIERMTAELARILPPDAAMPQMLRSRLGRDAAVLGAAMLPLHARFGPDADTGDDGGRAVRSDAAVPPGP